MLVVLDLNGTILDSTHKPRPFTQIDAMARKKYVYFRPHMHEFLSYLFNHPKIEVAVWTSNIAANAHAIIETAFTEEQRSQLKFVFSRAQCQLGANYTSFKKVSKILKMDGVNADNVIIVDDSENKVVPPSFKGWIRLKSFEAPNYSDKELIGLANEINNRILE